MLESYSVLLSWLVFWWQLFNAFCIARHHQTIHVAARWAEAKSPMKSPWKNQAHWNYLESEDVLLICFYQVIVAFNTRLQYFFLVFFFSTCSISILQENHDLEFVSLFVCVIVLHLPVPCNCMAILIGCSLFQHLHNFLCVPPLP